MSDSKSAIYLIGHGPYREPRLIELQYLRILRFLRELGSKLGYTAFETHTFIELNFPRTEQHGFCPEEQPQLAALIARIKAGEFQHVFIDLEEQRDARQPSLFFVRRCLELAGATVVNVDDRESEVVQAIIDREGKLNKPFYFPPLGASDFVNFFPALAARIAESVVEEALGQRRSDEPAAATTLRNELSTRVSDLARENPYCSGGIPLLRARVWNAFRVLAEKQVRREQETLYRTGPYGEGLLCDEIDLTARARSSDERQWAERRLTEDLEFQRVVTDRSVSFECSIHGHKVYADPRIAGRLVFYIYGSQDRYRGQVSLPDTWRAQLATRLRQMVRKQGMSVET